MEIKKLKISLLSPPKYFDGRKYIKANENTIGIIISDKEILKAFPFWLHTLEKLISNPVDNSNNNLSTHFVYIN